MDKIFLNQLAFYGYHGVFEEESVLGQRFIVDLELFLNLKAAGKSDDLKHSIHYGEVYNVAKEVVEGKRYQLLESVAEVLASKLLTEFPLLEACKIKLIKPDPPIVGHYESVGVEIYRERTDDE